MDVVHGDAIADTEKRKRPAGVALGQFVQAGLRLRGVELVDIGLPLVDGPLFQRPVQAVVGQDAVFDDHLVDRALFFFLGVFVAQHRDALVAFEVDLVEPVIGCLYDALRVQAAVENGKGRAADVVGDLYVGCDDFHIGAAAGQVIGHAGSGVGADAVVDQYILARGGFARKDVPGAYRPAFVPIPLADLAGKAGAARGQDHDIGLFGQNGLLDRKSTRLNSSH